MSEQLYLLPAPHTPPPRRSSKRLPFAILSLFLLGAFVIWNGMVPQEEILAHISLEQGSAHFEDPDVKNTLIDQKNHSLVRVMIDQQDYGMFRLEQLGLSFSFAASEGLSFLRTSSAQSSDTPSLQVSLHYKGWNSFLNQVRSSFERPEIKPEYLWNQEKGWILQEGRKGVVLNTSSEKAQLKRLLSALDRDRPGVLQLKTQEVAFHSAQEKNDFEALSLSLQNLIEKPLVLEIAGEVVELDLNREKDLILFSDGTATLHEKTLKAWIDNLVAQHTRPTSKVTIVGQEEVRPGIFKAVVEGEFLEGQRINADELYDQVIDAFQSEERSIKVKTYEIPVKVYSELEGTDYELLSVGYSEYSTGNDANRVHNVKTGLDRLNGLLVNPSQEISFNKSVGSINGEFRLGYGIYGSVALPVLGGGICQSSTTFYRALLNLGVPITMRQNHSWDLSYYQTGGYGLDATIYPAKGLDVKAVNDLPGQLFFYSYIRPGTEEAFVLVYGKGDGRKVTLTPEKEYVPYRGAKTLKWKQEVEMPSGEIRESEIVSRYRA